jgi:hypothetical protein
MGQNWSRGGNEDYFFSYYDLDFGVVINSFLQSNSKRMLKILSQKLIIKSTLKSFKSEL